MKKVILNKDKCIACGTCVAIFPEFFTTDSGTIEFKREAEKNGDFSKVTPEEWKLIEEAASACPNTVIEIKEE